MNIVTRFQQQPAPGSRRLYYQGDCVTFTLTLDAPRHGEAWLRTNLSQARIQRREIIDRVDTGAPPLGRDWFDLPMSSDGDRRFSVTVGLSEVGHFEAKCFFLPEGANDPLWPPGANSVLNVEPADTCRANIVYNAFVRQFGPSKGAQGQPRPDDEVHSAPLDAAGYTVIPPSGTFRDLVSELDFIIDTLGCRVIQLLPIHPTPTTYARMGRFGSPYAALSFTAVDPALAVFDPKATPLEQFAELVDGVHGRGALLFIDIAINHTGWAAGLHESHPRWLARSDDGEIEVPGAWGITWADLTRLDYRHTDLWQYMADVFLIWCRRGVDGFRCDAGYMIPAEAWRYILARVKDQYPDTIFFLEGLGGKIAVTRDLLNRANFNWAYSELFQNYDRHQIDHYLPEALEISTSDGITLHYAETHDNNRLAARSHSWAKMRTALCALLSHQGGFGFANGVEWFATEKIDVHKASALNWGAAENQVAALRRLTTLIKTHAAFGHRARLENIAAGSGNFAAVARHAADPQDGLVILANLDDQSATEAVWDSTAAPFLGEGPIDLLSGERPPLNRSGSYWRSPLAPGAVRCLSGDSDAHSRLSAALAGSRGVPTSALARQQTRASVLMIHAHLTGSPVYPQAQLENHAAALRTDPEGLCAALNPNGGIPCSVTWHWPQDAAREVMVPPGFFLIVRARDPFRAEIRARKRTLATAATLKDAEGGYFAVLPPVPIEDAGSTCALHLRRFSPTGCDHAIGPLRYLAAAHTLRTELDFPREAISSDDLLLDTSGTGAMLRARVDWGSLGSRYDALLAANLNPEGPDDRRILLTRIRAWCVFQGYSQTVDLRCLEFFGRRQPTGGWWQFQIPTGQGQTLRLRFGLEMIAGENRILLHLHRPPAGGAEGRLADAAQVKLILRADIEDRSFHDTTKALFGPEHQFPAATRPLANGFRFIPSAAHGLEVTLAGSRFVHEPEWAYMVHRPWEAQRGLDPLSDLFSPGYFQIMLSGGARHVLQAAVVAGEAPAGDPPETTMAAEMRRWRPGGTEAIAPSQALGQALNHYTVRRGRLATVIAGYPWFLDWGRDTLIVARGLIAAGELDTTEAIVRQFAGFESHGTLPNMIRGNDASNRDTSDAPLWLFVVCAELAAARAETAWLGADCQGRPLLTVLTDLAHALIRGTANGVVMDPGSGLLFSPSHFTWMDTNYPAGSPREGYPIEIQALWYAALAFLAEALPAPAADHWRERAAAVKRAIGQFYFDAQCGYLIDCLHAPPGTPAAQAEADTALRPNQLLALTLGAVEDPHIFEAALRACQRLLVPGAIRSLADQAVSPPLAIYHGGQLLNDPSRPYWGRYEGDEDTRRKPAYHNGTAWAWPFPSYCEAWAQHYGAAARPSALAWLGSAVEKLGHGCLGQLPEVQDGNAPHQDRGCDAQAWSVSEVLRVWLKLGGG
ncbi:MAG: amylo-alpha-1,6-glucosidase [Desulfosarcinaceae bacterium]|nr:amylo-alpha-1,6-glucosidase [Desulfosarcinaceae bacterium]